MVKPPASYRWTRNRIAGTCFLPGISSYFLHVSQVFEVIRPVVEATAARKSACQDSGLSAMSRSTSARSWAVFADKNASATCSMSKLILVQWSGVLTK